MANPKDKVPEIPRWSDISNLATLRSKGVFVIAATQGLIQLDLLLGTAATEAL